MSGGSSNKEAIALQRESLDEQRRTNAFTLEQLAKQTRALEKTKLPPYVAAAPPPTPGTSGADYAAAQTRLSANRRFGVKNTVVGGMRYGTA